MQQVEGIEAVRVHSGPLGWLVNHSKDSQQGFADGIAR